MALVDLHDVPETGPPADFHHGLGFDLGFFAEAGAQPAAEDNCFHEMTRLHRCLDGFEARSSRAGRCQ